MVKYKKSFSQEASNLVPAMLNCVNYANFRYPTPHCSSIKNVLRSIALKSVDRTHLKNTKIMGGQCSSL